MFAPYFNPNDPFVNPHPPPQNNPFQQLPQQQNQPFGQQQIPQQPDPQVHFQAQPGAAQAPPPQLGEEPFIPFLQLDRVAPEIQNHGQLQQPPQAHLLYNQLLRNNGHLSAHEHAHNRRAQLVGTPASQRSELHSVTYRPAQKTVIDPFTGTQVKTISEASFEDNLLSYIHDDRLRSQYEENLFTKQQKKILQTLQFNELKKQNLNTLSSTCIDKIVHSYAAKIISSDVVYRVLEEHWPQLKDIFSLDEQHLLAATRSANLQIDTGVYSTLTRSETDLLKLAASDSKNHYKLKRSIQTTPNSLDPLVSLQNDFKLKSTSRKAIDPGSVSASNLIETTQPAIPPSKSITMKLLNQLPSQPKAGEKRKRDNSQ